MVNPRYKPFNGNSRKPAVKQPEKILSETKTDFVYPPKEEYIKKAETLMLLKKEKLLKKVFGTTLHKRKSVVKK